MATTTAPTRRERDRLRRAPPVVPSATVRTRSAVILFALVAACGGDDESVPVDAPVAIDTAPLPIDASVDAAPFVEPTRLSQTGLYSDIGTKTIAADVHEFLPRWQLWSDEALKRRWIWLPPGATIDTSNMDNWKFPVGTKVWKEFARGTRIETRYLEKIGPGDEWITDWYAVSFQWDAGETDATAVPAGVVDDPGHNDIPGRSDCRKCHVNTRVASVVIGFSALQLDTPTAAGLWNLTQLVAENRLSAPPTASGGAGTPFFPLPAGDAARDANGYLHANCGNCHNAGSDVALITPVKLRLAVGDLAAWNTTDPWETTVDVTATFGVPGATVVVEPGVPAQSALYYRLTTTSGQRMPPVGREVVDPTGTETVRAWIAALPPTP